MCWIKNIANIISGSRRRYKPAFTSDHTMYYVRKSQAWGFVFDALARAVCVTWYWLFWSILMLTILFFFLGGGALERVVTSIWDDNKPWFKKIIMFYIFLIEPSTFSSSVGTLKTTLKQSTYGQTGIFLFILLFKIWFHQWGTNHEWKVTWSVLDRMCILNVAQKIRGITLTQKISESSECQNGV